MYTDISGCMPEWLSITLSVVAIVAVTALIVSTVIVSAGAAGVAVSALATAYGASVGTAAALATMTTVGAYIVATCIALTGASNVGEAITGHNVIRDDCLGGNQQAYDQIQIGLSLFAAGIIYLGEVGRIINSSSAHHEGPGAKTYNPNLKLCKDSFLKQNGINIHAMKSDILGSDANMAHFDTYIDKNTGQLYLCQKNGIGYPIPTDYYLP